MSVENNIQRVISQAEAILENNSDARSRAVILPQDFVNRMDIILRDYDSFYHIPSISEDDYVAHLDSNVHGLYEKFSSSSKRESFRNDTVEMSIYPGERFVILDALRCKKLERLSPADTKRIDELASDFETYYDKAERKLKNPESENKGVRQKIKRALRKFKEE